MMSILLAIARYIGVAGCAVVALLVYYEGVPGLRDIPGVRYVPIVRDLVVGRVEKVAAEAVETATADLVDRAELVAVREKAEEFLRQINIMKRLTAEAEKKAVEARLEADRAREELEKAIADDTDPDVSRWRQHDLDRLRIFDQRAPP